MRTSFHHQPEAQHPNFQLSTSWQADYPIFRGSCGHKQSYDRSLFRVGAACRPDFAATLPSSPGLAACALPLASCFLTSIAGVFDVDASDDFCLPPAAVSRALAESVLPLPFCFVASISAVFDLGAGDGFHFAFAVLLLAFGPGGLRFRRQRRLV